MTYFLTFTCYGAWIPGDERGWVERARDSYRGGYKNPSADLAQYARKIMPQEPYQLDVPRARIVLDAICEACQYRDWGLVAAHVRATHVHVIVDRLGDPGRAISDFKSYSSRALNRHGFETADRKRWARGGSTRRLPTAGAIRSTIQYVVESQGEPMAVFQEQQSPR
jgi:REP element-mobilizing transposase RayT